MRIMTPDSKHWEPMAQRGMSREAIRRAVRQASAKAMAALPPVSPFLTIMISPDEPYSTIKETGVGGITFTEEYISITIDYNVPHGARDTIKHLRELATHEMVHASSYFNVEPWKPAPLQAVVYEGLGTVFEKQFANAQPLWGEGEDAATMQTWFEELKGLPEDAKNFDYLFDHPDGRRWIIYKTGTWVIETLLASGKYTLNDLVLMKYTDVLAAFERISR